MATVESALFSPDVVLLLAALLDARDLCQVSLTCKTLGGKQAAHNGLSLVEEAAKRIFEHAVSVWERSCLPKYDDEGWVELYHHLLMLRSKLTFGQLVGDGIRYGEDQSIIRPYSGCYSSAFCSDHVMRSGRHFAVFSGFTWIQHDFGIVRPVQINESDFAVGQLNEFSPTTPKFREYLRGKRTGRRGNSTIDCCAMDTAGFFRWQDWTSNGRRQSTKIDGFQLVGVTFSLLLDLDEGMLSVYQNGQRLATLKDGLSGEYCWFVTACWSSSSFSIQRDQAPEN